MALLAGSILGALAWFSDDLGYPFGLLIPANLVGVWGLVAFGAGAGARTIVGGAGRGLFALLAAVAVYYLAYGLLGDGWRAAGAFRAATIWGAVAVVAGPALGLAGSAWRHRTGWPRSLGIAVPAGLLIAEGLVLGAQVPNDPPARALLAVEALVGLLLPAFLVSGARWRAHRLRGDRRRGGRGDRRAAHRPARAPDGRRHVLIPGRAIDAARRGPICSKHPQRPRATVRRFCATHGPWRAQSLLPPGPPGHTPTR